MDGQAMTGFNEFLEMEDAMREDDPDSHHITSGEAERMQEKAEYDHDEIPGIGNWCARCGEVMTFNIPRLGPDGGFVHARTGNLDCAITSFGSDPYYDDKQEREESGDYDDRRHNHALRQWIDSHPDIRRGIVLLRLEIQSLREMEMKVTAARLDAALDRVLAGVKEGMG